MFLGKEFLSILSNSFGHQAVLLRGSEETLLVDMDQAWLM
jgi:hypothetical protein